MLHTSCQMSDTCNFPQLIVKVLNISLKSEKVIEVFFDTHSKCSYLTRIKYNFSGMSIKDISSCSLMWRLTQFLLVSKFITQILLFIHNTFFNFIWQAFSYTLNTFSILEKLYPCQNVKLGNTCKNNMKKSFHKYYWN